MMFKSFSGAVALLMVAPATAFAPGSFSTQKKVCEHCRFGFIVQRFDEGIFDSLFTYFDWILLFYYSFFYH